MGVRLRIESPLPRNFSVNSRIQKNDVETKEIRKIKEELWYDIVIWSSFYIRDVVNTSAQVIVHCAASATGWGKKTSP